MTRPALTAAESRVLSAVQKFHRRTPPRAPLLKEIAESMERCIATVYDHALRLERKGYLRRESPRSGWHLVV